MVTYERMQKEVGIATICGINFKMGDTVLTLWDPKTMEEQSSQLMTGTMRAILDGRAIR